MKRKESRLFKRHHLQDLTRGKSQSGASEMAPQKKARVVETDDLSSVPRTHTVIRKNRVPQVTI